MAAAGWKCLKIAAHQSSCQSSKCTLPLTDFALPGLLSVGSPGLSLQSVDKSVCNRSRGLGGFRSLRLGSMGKLHICTSVERLEVMLS